MIKGLLDEFLLNIPYDCMNFISYASYRNNLRKKGQILTKNQNSLGIGHQNLGISTEKGRRRITRQENAKNLDR